MTKEEVIEMAKKAGLHIATDVNWMPIIGLEYAEKFVDLVVNECCRAFWSDECKMSDLAYGEYYRNAKKIRQHFGAKE
jgi:hypothetical protein